MDEASGIIQHKNRYIIAIIISAVVAVGEFTISFIFKAQCLFSDACSNLIDTIMYCITI